MSVAVAILFGVVQGLAEFLPVSSSGHLALLGAIFGLGEQTLLTAVLLHIATFLSVCVVMHKQIWQLIKKPFGTNARKLYVASLITVGIVLLIKSTVEKSFENLSALPWCFLVTALLLLASEYYSNNLFTNKKIDYKRATLIGFVQGLAALPGISRSGATIGTALFCKVEKTEATDFSFILSLPIILASAIYEAIKIKDAPPQSFDIVPNAVAFFVAFVVGIFAIKIMKTFLKKARMWWFSVYLLVVAIVLFLC